MPRWVLSIFMVLKIGGAGLFMAQFGYGHQIDQVFMEVLPEARSFSGTIFIDAPYCLVRYRTDDEVMEFQEDWMLTRTEEQHAELRMEAEAYIREALSFQLGEEALSYDISFPDYDSTPYDFYKSLVGAPTLRIAVSGDYVPAGGELIGSWQDSNGASLLIELLWEEGGEQMRNFIQLESDTVIQVGVTVEPYDSAGRASERVEGARGVEELTPPMVRKEAGGWWRTVKIGFEHIVPKGLDHIVFVVGVFLFSPLWRPLLHQTLTFTLAHSVTLALSLVGVITFPSKWVEVIIALSIVYVAVENLWGGRDVGARRLGLIFVFGLLHGLGFGSVLGEYLPKERIFYSLIGFNLGVELGQVLVLGACFLLFGWFVHSFTWIRRVGSLMVGAVGLYWVVERVMG